MSKRIKVMVSLVLPDGATRKNAVDYVEDAVATMHGCLRPDGWDGEGGEGDPMFYLDSESVRATDTQEKLSED